MRETNMEKLIELLNDYEKRESGISNARTTNFAFLYYLNPAPISELNLISKKYGFIKWLVENEKIDYGKIFNLTKDSDKLSMIADLDNNIISWEDTLLMLLSIQDNPIEFLISILK